jgi:putative hemolysin
MSTELLIILCLLLLNAFFAASEMAIVSASKPKLRQKAKTDKRAELALRLAEDSGRFLSTVQVGITLVGILAGAYGGAEIADKLAPILNDIALIAPRGELVAVILVVALITYFSVVIGELIPKQIALANSEALAIRIARPMYVLSVIFTPIVATLESSANLFFRILGIQRNPEQMTESEIKAVLAEGAASGAIEKNEYDMLQRIIRLDDRSVESIMTHRIDVTFLDINDSVSTIRRKIQESGHSRYPVISGDESRVIGIVQAKDLLDAALKNPDELKMVNHLKEATYLPEVTKCLRVLEFFKTSSTHIAIIVNEYGTTEGIVTSSDILEAIVGVMPSNYNDDSQPLIVQRADGSWLVDGATPIDEIHLSIGLEDIDADSSYETIAGFILYTLGRTPRVSEYIDTYGYRFEIVDLDGMRIDKILISKISELPAAEHAS